MVSDTVHTVYRRVTGFRGVRVVFDTAVGSMDLATATLSRPVHVPIQGYAPARTARDGTALSLWKVAGDWSQLMNSTVAVTAPAITEYTVTAADYTPVTTPAQRGPRLRNRRPRR